MLSIPLFHNGIVTHLKKGVRYNNDLIDFLGNVLKGVIDLFSYNAI